MTSESRKAPSAAAESRELPDWRALIGHSETMSALRVLAAKERLPQVMMLVGRSGLGKRGLLVMQAALSLCDRRTACGECSECRAVLFGTHPEVHWVEPEDGKILIEAAADLQDFLALEPESRGGRPGTRVVLIADGDRMTPQAANRLLKTLEEPPERSRIIMTTSRPRALLETVRSRCVAWRIAPPSPTVTLPWLAAQVVAAKSGAQEPSPEMLADWIKRAGLAPGAALTLALSEEGESTLQEDLRLAAAATFAGSSAGFGRLEEGLDACARATRATKIGIESLLAEYEMAVNAAYHRGEHPPAAALARRRERLSRARSLAAFGRVALNAQLAAEAATMAGRGAP